MLWNINFPVTSNSILRYDYCRTRSGRQSLWKQRWPSLWGFVRSNSAVLQAHAGFLQTSLGVTTACFPGLCFQGLALSTSCCALSSHNYISYTCWGTFLGSGNHKPWPHFGLWPRSQFPGLFRDIPRRQPACSYAVSAQLPTALAISWEQEFSSADKNITVQSALVQENTLKHLTSWHGCGFTA